MKDKVAIFLIFVAAVCSFAGGFTIAIEYAVKPLLQQAVARGFAYWNVLEDGKTEFRWKEEE